MAATIVRGEAPGPGRSAWVKYNGLVYTVAFPTDRKPNDSCADQTRKALANLDERLKKAGTDKSKIIEATVFLKDMSTFSEMDKVWCEYIQDGCSPSRATVGADLGKGVLVEIKVTAAAPADLRGSSCCFSFLSK
eukprot:CAMPEP_0169072154 /NCGR_PEP_ID=MMETSP1015-20121227/6040_1 /TAXON_ID=342587 /ORGANISM="Karlodinium micrum, Strain CCMP2283" /LENGTH=134 /DNA_ID=CAMNT_0009131285 /DNA_START=53 /DNA_END=457 /DNA_ORIENTATION=+